MAKIKWLTWSFEGTGNGVKAYTVETAVGAGQSNQKRSDVELVQFFLYQFFLDPIHRSLTPKTAAGTTNFKIDGIAGNQTIQGIRIFQDRMKKFGQGSIVDGIVNIPLGESQHRNTMWSLNAWCYSWGKDKERFGEIENLPEVIAYAPHLRTDLLSMQD